MTMTDVLTPAQRRLNMSRIRGCDTKPEMLLRKALHARGLRFRLHRRDLPGRPDLVFSRYRSCLLVHGCFWHGHNCTLFQWPATRKAFWADKIASNQRRDHETLRKLLGAGWRALVVWECALRGPRRRDFSAIIDECVDFIIGSRAQAEIVGCKSIEESQLPAD